MSSIIEDLIARKVFNNRGEETIEVDVVTTAGFGRAAAPAGKSRGKAEVVYYPTGGVDAAIKKLIDTFFVPAITKKCCTKKSSELKNSLLFCFSVVVFSFI